MQAQHGSARHLLKSEDAQHPPNLGAFSEGEELTYEVSYMGIALGTVTSRVTHIDTIRNNVYIKAEGLIKTYKGVPFVTLNTIFQSTFDRNVSSVSFSTKEYVQDTTWKYIHYKYKPRRDSLYIMERIGNEILQDKYLTVPLDGYRWQDGLSLLFYARAHALQTYRDTVPVMMYINKAKTFIHFGSEREEMEIDKIDYPIKTVKLEGEGKFTGIFGLTGEFEGWFSDDYAAVPIYAKMHVLIGSIKLELIRWKKKGWSPPGT